MKEGDDSRRVPDSCLEHVWRVPSPERVLVLPQWAKRDEVVQGMVDREDVEQVIYHGDQDQSRRHTPPIRSISSTPPDEKITVGLLKFDRGCERILQEKKEERAARRKARRERSQSWAAARQRPRRKGRDCRRSASV